MKILTTCYEFPPIGGGGSKVADGLIRELRHQDIDIDFITMGFRSLPKQETKYGARIHRIPCVRLSEAICTAPEMLTYVGAAIPKARQLIKKNHYDLNHTHFIFPDGLISLALKKMTGLPYIITAHGSDVPGYNPNRFKFQHKLLHPLWEKIVKNAEAIISPSEALAALIRKQRAETHIISIPNGITVDRYRSDANKKMRVLCVTRMFERKGVQYLLRSLNGLSPKCEVNIVGNGPYLSNLKQEAKDLGVNVNFLGWLDNDSPILKDLYETSQIFVFPSKSENFAIVLLEAMIAGMAIITTEGTGCAETVGEAGVLVKTEDSAGIQTALRKLLTQPKLCQELGRTARKRVEDNFSWQSIAHQYIQVYEKYAK